MGSANSKASESTINWNKIGTDKFSPSMPIYQNLSNEAKELIANLNIPPLTSESNTSDYNNLISNITSKLNINDQKEFTHILNQLSSSEQSSATSPFISTQDYNKYINSTTSDDNIQKGGQLDDSSSTSSTSSFSSSSNSVSSSESPKKKKSTKKYGGSSVDLSYLSSSAHTDGDNTEPNEDANANEMMSSSISVNTDDINMVSSD